MLKKAPSIWLREKLVEGVVGEANGAFALTFACTKLNRIKVE